MSNTVSVISSIIPLVRMGTPKDFEAKCMLAHLLLQKVTYKLHGDFDAWIGAESAELQAWCGNEYRQHVDAFISKGIIEIRETIHGEEMFKYKGVGEHFTKLYKFKTVHHSFDITQVELTLSSNRKNMEHVIRFYQRKNETLAQKDECIKLFMDQSCQFSIDPRVQIYIDRQRAVGKLTLHQYDCIQRSVEAINQNIGSISRDSAGRFYIAIQQLPREIRGAFLLINGRHIVEVDIHGAHMSFIVYLLTGLYPQDEALKTECDRISGWLQTSDVYQEMVALGEVSSLSRSEFKEKLNAWINSRPDRGNRFMTDFMPTHFPRMTELLNIERAKPERDLGFQLRKIESELMIDTMFRVYVDNDIGFAPIHDGVAVVTDQGQIVKAMVETMMRTKNIRSKTKIKSITCSDEFELTVSN